MSKYTTGEIAKLCGVTVRTVQYYDTRGILIPTELSEGGRRLYSEDDLKRMQIICFLRELGLPIDSISQILSEDDSGSVISLLLEQQEQDLKEEIGERQEKLEKLEALRRELKSVETISVESIGDVAYKMSNKKKLKKIHRNLILYAIPLELVQWTAYFNCTKNLVADPCVGSGYCSLRNLDLKVLFQTCGLSLPAVSYDFQTFSERGVLGKAYPLDPQTDLYSLWSSWILCGSGSRRGGERGCVIRNLINPG